MTKELIINHLQEQMHYAQKQLNLKDNQIVGIFLYGSQNYMLDTKNSDIDSTMVVLPTFSDMCLGKQPLSKEVCMENGEHINVKDIREYKNMLMKQNICFMETLYTEYFILNTAYEKIFTAYFINDRESISHMDRARTIKAVGNQLINTINQGPTDNKKLANGKRLLYFLKNYTCGQRYMNCLQLEPNKRKELLELKAGTSAYSQNEELKLKDSKQLTLDTENLIKLFGYITTDQEQYTNTLNKMNEGVKELITLITLAEISNKDLCSKKEFFDALTHAEERAYESIRKEIHDEGNIIISQLVKENSISRPVYNNLLIKMKEMRVAEVENKGVKGTYIKIIHKELKEK